MFSSHIILYFIARIAGTNSFLLFLWISRKITPLTAKNALLRVSMYTYTYWLIGCRSCLKSGKIRMLVVKWLWKNETFEGKKRRGRPKVLNKAAKIVLKKARYKIGDSTPERIRQEKRMFKIRTWHDKKYPICLVCQVTPISSQICKEVQKPCCGKGPEWLSFLDESPNCFFFQLPKLTNIVWGLNWLLRTGW